MLDFKTMDNAKIADSFALCERWRKGEGEFWNRPKKKLPYLRSEVNALMAEVEKRVRGDV